MDELFNKHTVKIQLGVATLIVGFVIYWTFVGTGYVNKVQVHEQTITEIKPKVERIPIMEDNIADIKDDISEIKDDVKTLIKQR